MTPSNEVVLIKCSERNSVMCSANFLISNELFNNVVSGEKFMGIRRFGEVSLAAHCMPFLGLKTTLTVTHKYSKL